VIDETIPGKLAATVSPEEDGYETVDDLGDALELTRNGRAQVTENNRGHG
jgi:hypothetical protein